MVVLGENTCVSSDAIMNRCFSKGTEICAGKSGELSVSNSWAKGESLVLEKLYFELMDS